ncbi:MAG: nucleotidyltransferase [Paludibacteraceae bacterium]|nr:nucleotidyltransferase [Paludibacteraceae bacterium]
MKPTLFILAAGMGSRYGGLKQLDGVGPSGETIMDYSVFDAIRAGFGKIVFVIRHDFEQDFREKVLSKYSSHIPVEVCFQSVDALPEGFKCPEGRTKPWGTNHAVLMAKNIIKEPFAVINADDFYGRNGFEVLAEDLSKLDGKTGDYCMVGYRVGNTLSESGTVNRGVCTKDSSNCLTDVVERINIGRNAEGKIVYPDGDKEVELDKNTPVSMNMWGFTTDYFEYSEAYFVDFLKESLNKDKSEFYIPVVVNDLIKKGKAKVRVLDTTATWFGVTYNDDRPMVVAKLAELVKKGEYPSPLFSK